MGFRSRNELFKCSAELNKKYMASSSCKLGVLVKAPLRFFQKHFWRLHGKIFLWGMPPSRGDEGIASPLLTSYNLLSICIHFHVPSSTLSSVCSSRWKALFSTCLGVLMEFSKPNSCPVWEHLHCSKLSSLSSGFLPVIWENPVFRWLFSTCTFLESRALRRGAVHWRVFSMSLHFFSLGDRVLVIFIYPLLIKQPNIH